MIRATGVNRVAWSTLLSDEQYAAGNVRVAFLKGLSRESAQEEVRRYPAQRPPLVQPVLCRGNSRRMLRARRWSESWREYQSVISDKVLGELTLNKDLDPFDGMSRGEESGSRILSWPARKHGNKPQAMSIYWRPGAVVGRAWLRSRPNLHANGAILPTILPNQTEQHRDGRRRTIFRILT